MTEFVRDFGSFMLGIGVGMVLSVIIYAIIDLLQRLIKRRTAPQTPGAISGTKDG